MVNCSKLRKAECLEAKNDCHWIVNKGCRSKPKEEAKKKSSPKEEPKKKSSSSTEKSSSSSNEEKPKKIKIDLKIKKEVNAFIKEMYTIHETGIELLKKNPRATKVEFNKIMRENPKYKTGGFHIDSHNITTLQVNLENYKTILDDICKNMKKEPTIYLDIYDRKPWDFPCLDARIDILASILYNNNDWDDKKPFEANIMNIIDLILRPRCRIILDYIEQKEYHYALREYERVKTELMKSHLLKHNVLQPRLRDKKFVKQLNELLVKLFDDTDDLLNITQAGTDDKNPKKYGEYVDCGAKVLNVKELTEILNAEKAKEREIKKKKRELMKKLLERKK